MAQIAKSVAAIESQNGKLVRQVTKLQALVTRIKAAADKKAGKAVTAKPVKAEKAAKVVAGKSKVAAKPVKAEKAAKPAAKTAKVVAGKSKVAAKSAKPAGKGKVKADVDFHL